MLLVIHGGRCFVSWPNTSYMAASCNATLTLGNSLKIFRAANTLGVDIQILN